MRFSDDLYQRARGLVASRLGLDFPEARRTDLERGVARALRASPVSTPEEFLGWLATRRAEGLEWRGLAADLTVGETYFFRDAACFDALEREVLPALIQSRRSEGVRRLRVWSAGCATGEEPYSLAIVLDRLLPDRAEWSVVILATDISPRALETARRGRYREWSLRETPGWIRQQYFRRREDGVFELDPRIRAMVTLGPLNLAAGGFPGVVTNTVAMDVILCRNVLMYFTREAQQATVARLERALVSRGWLAVSAAEASAELFRALTPARLAGAVFYRKGPASDAPGLPSWGAGMAPPEVPAPLPILRAPSAPASPREPPAPSRRDQAGASADVTIDLQRARALADEGDLEQARDLCETALARNRLDPDAHFLLAAICQEQGEMRAAVDALRRTLYLAPGSAPAHFLLGSLLLQQGQRRRGKRSMETVVDLLGGVPRDEVLPAGDGLTAGRLLEMAQAYLASA